jgi:hypothetical protein
MTHRVHDFSWPPELIMLDFCLKAVGISNKRGPSQKVKLQFREIASAIDECARSRICPTVAIAHLDAIGVHNAHHAPNSVVGVSRTTALGVHGFH